MNYRSLVLSALLIINTLNVFAATNGVPALSITASNGLESILIGSAHVGIEGLLEPDKSIFKNAKRFVIEHDVINFYPTPLPTLPVWAQGLTSDEREVYFKRVNCFGLSNDIGSWALLLPTTQYAILFAYTDCENPRIQSRDEWIKSIKPSQLKIDVLEDATWVESQRIMADTDKNNTGLKWILAREPKVVMGEIRDDLNVGNYESILQKSLAPLGSPQAIKKYKDIMVTGRNIAWMPKLKQYLDDGHAVIVVGAAHLPGENGLISLLQSNGYTVKTITLPESQ